jgi:serine phosphatase RsbU (regulator of sigma subunit)/pSer/pThr/pTyr-binding forkhead associated (FHA) protein
MPVGPAGLSSRANPFAGDVMAILQVLSGHQPGRTLPLDAQEIVLGRNPECTIMLDAPAVSRQHARITRREGEFFIEDLQSRNGTFVNGEPVLKARPLRESDQVAICDEVFIFRAGPPSNDDLGQAADPATSAALIDDEAAVVDSRIMSRVELSAGPTSLQLQVNSEAKLKALLEISKTLGRSLGLNDVLAKILEGLFRIFNRADRGFVVLKDNRTGRLVPKAVRYRRAQHAETIRISRTIVDTVMNTKEAILSADAASDSRFLMSESIVDFQIRSMMCSPLVSSDGRVLGVIQIDTLDQRNRFSRDDLDVLASVAVQASFAVENAELHEASVREQALNRELLVAHRVQRNLLPSSPPQVDGYEFFDYYEAANELGGDYYDYVPLPDGRLGIVIADVAGKGISASLLMARLSAETRYCLVSEPSPAAAVRRLNQTFCDSGWEDRFVTFALCILDPRQHHVTVVNAGHLPPLLRRPATGIESIGDAIAGYPLGIDTNAEYGQCVVSLEPGDCLTLYTDGITEAMSPTNETFGRLRLEEQVAALASLPREIGQRVLDCVKTFVGPRRQSDDICLTVVGRTAL